MTYFKIFLFIFIHCIVTQARISDKRLCADPNCSEPISLAKTLLTYASNDRQILSFPKNVPVKIFSKAAGSRSDLWGAEINGRRGYVPISHVRETKILKTKLDYLVSTDEEAINNSAPTIPSEVPSQDSVLETKSAETVPVTERISPNTVSAPYEVIDGTTVYYQSSNDAVVSQSASIPVDVTTVEPVLSVTPDPAVVYNNLNSNIDTAKVKEIVDIEQTEVETKEPVENKDSGVLDSISKMLFTDTDADDAQVSDEEDDEEDSEDDEEIEETEENKSEETKTDTSASITDKILDTASAKVIEINSDISNTNSSVKESEEIIASAKESGEDNKEQISGSDAGQLMQNDVAKSVENNVAAVQSTQNAKEVVEHPNKEPDYKDFYGVPSNFLRNSFNTLPKASAEVTDQQQVDTVHSQVPDSPLPPAVVSDTPPVAAQAEFTTPAPAVHEIPVPIDTYTESPVTQNPSDVNVQEINESSEQTNEILNNTSTEINNVQENIDSTLEEKINGTENNNVQDIIHNTSEETINSTESSEQLVYDLENMNVQENLTSLEVENSEQSKENIENIVSQPIINNEPANIVNMFEQSEHTTENIISQDVNETTNEEPINNSAENSQELVNDAENIEQPEPNLNLENLTPNQEKNILEDISVENSIQENTENKPTENNIPTESSIENNDLNSKEEIIEESVTVSEESTEKVEMSVQNADQSDEITEQSSSDDAGFFANMYSSIFGSSDEPATVEDVPNVEENKISEERVEEMSVQDTWSAHAQEKPADKYTSLFGEHRETTPALEMQTCQSGQDSLACPLEDHHTEPVKDSTFELPDNAYSIFLYLTLTSVTLLLFILGYYYIEKKRNDSSLVVNINKLEKNLLISSKECLLLQDELNTTKERLSSIEDSSFGSNEMVTALKEELDEAKNVKLELEEQITNLEKELENATEAGMELNRMLREVLGTQSGNEHLMQNIEHLQKQLNEQQMTINSMNSALGVKTTENELLQTELTVAQEKITQLQAELDKMVVNLLSVQEEKCKGENDFEEQTQRLKNDFDMTIKSLNGELNVLKDENAKLKSVVDETQRALNVKNNEYALLKEGMKDVQAVQSNKDSLKALLDVSKVKAEVQQLRQEKHKMAERYQAELEAKQLFEKEVQVMIQEVQILKDKFEEAEREKVEAQTRLEVLSGYFKEKEAQLQKEINENESKWMQKEGEATSTIERIKWIQEELQNYKSQNELLKKEILDQEVSLKSQISMLEKKSHDNWVLARQAERRVEESKQEASQLRNRLTIVEKNLNNTSQVADESKMQNRIMSPLESNGELPVSPLHMSNVENPGSPPLMFPHRDHMTTSPPIPGLPPFMPPPPGVPFMPPPLPGVPPFMPPPPALYPGDHRPPPLGRMSSPPLYSPDSRPYSPYDRDDSPPLSPTYTDSDYRRRSPPPPPSSRHMSRNYSPYNSGKGRQSQWDEDREYRGQQHRNKPRNHKGPGLSSGSGNSNESLDNSGRHSGRI